MHEDDEIENNISVTSTQHIILELSEKLSEMRIRDLKPRHLEENNTKLKVGLADKVMQNDCNNSSPLQQRSYANVVQNTVANSPNQHTILLNPVDGKNEKKRELASKEEVKAD